MTALYPDRATSEVRDGDAAGNGGRNNCHDGVATRGHGATPAVGAARLREQLVASAEPAVVFASLAAACATGFCDACTIDVVEEDTEGYRLRYPPTSHPELAAATFADEPPTRGLARWAGRLVRGFDDESPVSHRPYSGRAVFAWATRQPDHADGVIADLLLDYAVAVIARQRSEERLEAVRDRAEHLAVALQTSRQIGAAIGVLMATYKVTEQAAFELLRHASQQENRKLREIALEVLDTGWLGPASTALGRQR